MSEAHGRDWWVYVKQLWKLLYGFHYHLHSILKNEESIYKDKQRNSGRHQDPWPAYTPQVLGVWFWKHWFINNECSLPHIREGKGSLVSISPSNRPIRMWINFSYDISVKSIIFFFFCLLASKIFSYCKCDTTVVFYSFVYVLKTICEEGLQFKGCLLAYSGMSIRLSSDTNQDSMLKGTNCQLPKNIKLPIGSGTS